MLMPDDFRSFSKIKIDNHSFNKENLPSHFKASVMKIIVFSFYFYKDSFDLKGSLFFAFMLTYILDKNPAIYFIKEKQIFVPNITF
jgi:hypothetical protein